MAAEFDLDDEGAVLIGRKVIEMADRLKPMHAACPGVAAKWVFEMDDHRFVLSMTMEPKEGKT